MFYANNAVLNAAFRGDASAMAQLGAEAFAEGCLIQALYWLSVADLRGFPNLAPTISRCVFDWVQMGGPEMPECVNRTFSEEQRQYGFAAAMWFSNVNRVFARGWFNNAARAGNFDARAFMMKHGAHVG